MPELPDGTVTFLFTDVEGSTALLNAHPNAYRAAVRRHHDLLGEAVEVNHGVVFETVGDAVYAAFARPTDAVAAALWGQLALQREAWGQTPITVRMGAHLGVVEAQEGHYFGAPLYRCARLTATAHGGQVVLSEAVAAVVRDALPAGAALRDAGEHRLKDLARPERVYELRHAELRAEFPPLRSLDARPHNLPLQLTSFVGREAELVTVRDLLHRHRLVTLTGPGGTGKTRLALQAAADALVPTDGQTAFADGVWLVELAALADPGLVPQAVAGALGVREEPGRPLPATLTDALRPKHLLVLLDNCEHLLDACARLADALLRACPHLTVLATSREALGIAGEVTWRVPSLAVPEGAAGRPAPDAAGLARSAAVRLFADRAAAVRPGFAVTAENAAPVAQVCVRLDGIPLAIELAAARVRVLPPGQLLARLEDRFRLLTGGSRTALERHQTLQAAVDWSYDLLTGPERALFARLSVFAGGWTLEATEAVGADSDDPAGGGIEPDGVLDLLTRLVDKSLVVAEEQPDGSARYRLLETLRQYAEQKLAATGGEAGAARRRHAAHYLALAERAEPELEGPRQLAWLGRLEAELGNLRQALRWCLEEGGSAETGLRLAAALWHFWRHQGRQREGRAWLEAALGLPGAAARTAARAAALYVEGALAGIMGDGAVARARHGASVALWRELGDARGLARALAQLGLELERAGDPAAAAALLEEAVALARAAGDRWGLALALRFLGNLEIRGPAAPGGPAGGGASGPSPLEASAALFRELGDAWGLGTALNGLGLRAFWAGDHAAARALLEEGLALRRTMGDRLGVALMLASLAAVARSQGDVRAAAAFAHECWALAHELGSPALVATSLVHLGHVALAQGDAARAAALFEESLRLFGEGGQERGPPAVLGRAGCLVGLAVLAAARGQPGRALRLGGAAAALAQTTGRPLDPADQAALDGGLAPARRALPAEAQAAARTEGQAMSLEQAVADTLEEAPAPAPSPPPGSRDGARPRGGSRASRPAARG
jgi:predicted ATPase/class 3 adenylate cyclase